LKQLLAHGITIDVLVGVSAGAIVAGFYAGVGLDVDELIGDVPAFKGRHVLMHGLTLRAPQAARPLLRKFCGVIPERLRQLDQARFDRLHHGVQSLGIVCHDLVTNRPAYFSTVEHFGVPLGAVVKSSAALPVVIPSRAVVRNGVRVHLVDGGLSDSLPCAFASSVLGATHLVVSDCRRDAEPSVSGPSLVYIRPDLNGAGILRSPAGTLLEWVTKGEAACTRDVIDTIRGWVARRAESSAIGGSFQGWHGPESRVPAAV
jgi:predicted acylesterase/phospholipase RssA